MLHSIDSYFSEITRLLKTIDREAVAKAAKLIAESDMTVFCGNGGSYANASHMAGDILMNTCIRGNTCAVGDNQVSFSACGNDISYDDVFAAELRKRLANFKGGTTVVLLSTSGRSRNIIKAAETADKLGFAVVAVVGGYAKDIEKYSDVVISADGLNAGMLEAVHDIIGHVFVELINEHICEKQGYGGTIENA